jgi:hypothetical protein
MKHSITLLCLMMLCGCLQFPQSIKRCEKTCAKNGGCDMVNNMIFGAKFQCKDGARFEAERKESK